MSLVHLVNDYSAKICNENTKICSIFSSLIFSDGVFGLAFKEVSITDQRSTPIENLYKQGKIKNRLACIKLNGMDEKTGGELIIGGCDVDAEYWVPIDDSGFWQVNLTKLEVRTPDGEVKATFCDPQRPCKAILDSGTSDISKNRTRKK